ncbi:MAG: MBL fold metallo-hydrolase [Candidatus Thorarchaeota archaeon]|jgi:7,8-dihydropterin-6-yl-methyl-4-(beta-D-ribofuranosyl)aminobenzene 5'-phosphate synthase
MNNNQKIGLVVGVSAILVASVLLFPYFLGLNTISDPEEYQLDSIEYVKITVLVDNYPNGSLNSPWGLSMLVETENVTILFDSGPNPATLEENAEALGVDLSACDLVVVSHEHLDHVDGLTHISEIHDDLSLYTPYYDTTPKYWMSGFDVIEVEETMELSSGIAIIGESWERALAINVRNLGLVILAGCSHLRIENMVSTAIDELNVNETHMVIGGFHLASSTYSRVLSTVESLFQLGVQNIYPIHCSGDAIRNYLATDYPTNFGNASVGFQITIAGT